jgi:hypothetical protein
VEITPDFISEARRILAFVSEPSWLVTEPQSDEAHLAILKGMLSDTRESHPSLPVETIMNFVNRGDGKLIAITGHTEEAAQRAAFIAGIIRALPKMLEAVEDNIVLRERVDALLKHNNQQLFEMRDQRAAIRKLAGQVTWLLQHIPDAYLAPETDAA